MSVIVVVKDGRRVCMACDSQASVNSSRAFLEAPKIVRSGPLVIGADGTIAIVSFVRHVWVQAPEWPQHVPLARWVQNEFSPALRHWLKENDHLETRDGRTDFPGSALIALKGEFVHLDSGGNVAELQVPFWAIGSGAPEALGAMWAHRNTSTTHRPGIANTAQIGVEAAIALDPHCGGKIVVEWT